MHNTFVTKSLPYSIQSIID